MGNSRRNLHIDSAREGGVELFREKSVEILEYGTLISEENFDQVVARLSITHHKAIVSNDGDMTHWWSLIIDEEKWIYVGTLESFEKWKKEKIN